MRFRFSLELCWYCRQHLAIGNRPRKDLNSRYGNQYRLGVASLACCYTRCLPDPLVSTERADGRVQTQRFPTKTKRISVTYTKIEIW